MQTQHTFTAIIHQEENLYVAECPEVGTVSQGSSIDEAIANLKEATELYIEEMCNEGNETTVIFQGHPLITTFEAALHA